MACRWHKQYNHISSTEGEVIWLIRAEIQEKRPARRQYITVLTTGTIKLLCHLLFLAWEQGLFHPSQVKYSAVVVSEWPGMGGRGGRKTESKATNNNCWGNYCPALIDQPPLAGDITLIFFNWFILKTKHLHCCLTWVQCERGVNKLCQRKLCGALCSF